MFIVGETDHSFYFTSLGLSGNWFQVVVQLILLFFLDVRNKSKALAGHRILILMQFIHSSRH